ELPKEHIRHIDVVMLSRMNQHLLSAQRSKTAIDGGNLHKVWASAHYVQKLFHRVITIIKCRILRSVLCGAVGSRVLVNRNVAPGILPPVALVQRILKSIF